MSSTSVLPHVASPIISFLCLSSNLWHLGQKIPLISESGNGADLVPQEEVAQRVKNCLSSTKRTLMKVVCPEKSEIQSCVPASPNISTTCVQKQHRFDHAV